MTGRYFTVGKIVGTHGIKGELKIVSRTDFPDIRFAAGNVLHIFHDSIPEPVPATVQSARIHKNTYLLKFAEFDNINDVERFRGGTLKVPEEDLVELPEGEYYYHEIIGCRVVTEDGQEIGTVSDILHTGANDVWTVKRMNGKDVLVPVIDDVVLDVNVSERVITIRLLEGML